MKNQPKQPGDRKSAELFAVFKPVGPTSHDVIYQIKRLFPGEKVGHAGTLDPLASGVLVVGVGRAATKLLHADDLNEKEYVAEITLGQSSTTDDAEGDKTDWSVKSRPSEETLIRALMNFVGMIEQKPPAYSALKVAGTPAYKLARKGAVVDLAARAVEIKDIEQINYFWPVVTIRVVTGRGVYIRSLARDLGEQLGVGGFISRLERTRVGRFTLSGVTPIEALNKS